MMTDFNFFSDDIVHALRILGIVYLLSYRSSLLNGYFFSLKEIACINKDKSIIDRIKNRCIWRYGVRTVGEVTRGQPSL